MYEGNLYRPPSEGMSLLVQVTVGCSHNKCTFCYMYKDKKFRVKSMDEIYEHIKDLKNNTKIPVKKVFLCDGNALVMKTEDLKQILKWIKEFFPNCDRITAYAQPLDILRKTSEELSELYDLGLKMLYIGLESGSDKILKLVNKGVDSKDMIKASDILRKTKIKTSIMVISGLGGAELWKEHAIETAKVLNKMKADYLGLLTLMVVEGSQLKEDVDSGKFKLLSAKEVIEEMYLMLKNLEIDNCYFTSIHASNYINLRGWLADDKERLLKEIEHYRDNEEKYRPEHFRGL